MKRDFLKTFIAIIVAAFFIWSDYDPFNNGIMHAINFPIHEVGHLVFGPFGEFIGVAGGSIFQIIVPIFFCIYFFFRGEVFSGSLVLFWIGNNFFDVAVYAADALFMELPLWSWSGNADTTIHDWNYLLSRTNLLTHTDLVAGIIQGIGALISVIAIIAALFYARKTEDSNS